MAIKAQCGSCGAKVTAKDALAGKRVKCPKCSQPMLVPKRSAQSKKSPRAVSASQAATRTAVATPQTTYNPLLDLLDDAGVDTVSRGPTCENCGAEIYASAVVCVQCGYNMATGQMLETTVYSDEDGDFDDGMTDAQKLLAKAEREIEDMPISADGQDFGDGSDSMLIALVAFFFFKVLIIIGIATVLLMDQITEIISSAHVSLYASMIVCAICAIWITIVAFLGKPIHGVICLLTGGAYCVIFGFMQGKTLLMPTIMLLASAFIGLICYLYVSTPRSDDYGMLIPQGLALLGF